MRELKEGQLFMDMNSQFVKGKLTELELMQAIVLLESIAMKDYNIKPSELESKKFSAAFIAVALEDVKQHF